MIKSRFMRGSAYIDIKIEDRILTFITPMLNFVPVKINLDKIDEQKERLKGMDMDEKTLRELSNLKTEEEMFNDLKSDLIKSGWRCHGNR